MNNLAHSIRNLLLRFTNSKIFEETFKIFKLTYVSICWAYFFIFALIGLFVAFILPPFQVPDEPAHWLTAIHRIQAINGETDELCTLAASLPLHFEFSGPAVSAQTHQATNKFSTIETLTKTCTQSSIQYGNILTYPSMIIARAFVAPTTESPYKALALFYATRLISGLIIIGALLRFITLSKNSGFRPGTLGLLAITTSPLFMQQSFGVTADIVINAATISIVTVAIFWTTLRWLDTFIFLFFGLAAAFSKPIVVPIYGCLLILSILRSMAIDNDTKKSFLAKLRASGNPQFVALTATLLITLVCIYVGLNSNSALSSGQKSGVDAPAQIRFILEHPSQAIAAIFARLFDQFALAPLANPLGWLNASIIFEAEERWLRYSKIAYILDAAYVAIILLMAAVSQQSRSLYRKIARSLMSTCLAIIAILGYAILISLTMYIAWTPVGAPHVDGLQPRYFFPCLLMAFSCFPAAWSICRPAATLFTSSIRLRLPVFQKFLILAVGLLISSDAIQYAFTIIFSLAKRYW